MVSFALCNPTELVFGEDGIASLARLVRPGTRVLLLYGGGSIKRNGVYDQVKAALNGCTIEEFGGIEPNPLYETILKAAELCRRAGVELVLGVGGGSVIDAAKFLATIVPLKVDDPWDHLVGGGTVEDTLPVGAVLTLPATGSESNPVSVISRAHRKLKLPFANQDARPRFAILDPSTMASLDKRQLQNGVVDAFTHVIEQYLTVPTNTPVQFGFSEALLEVLIAWGPRLIERNDAESRENVMFAANQALNGLIGAGVRQDWSTHMIGHAITAIYDIDHARTLSMVMPALMRYKSGAKKDMLARYARRVWHIDEPDDVKAGEEAIRRTEEFFRAMGCPVRLSDVLPIRIVPEEIISHLDRAGQTALGEASDVRLDDVREILRLAA
jgi:NADP-dependent alcohol dehydrogenase